MEPADSVQQKMWNKHAVNTCKLNCVSLGSVNLILYYLIFLNWHYADMFYEELRGIPSESFD